MREPPILHPCAPHSTSPVTRHPAYRAKARHPIAPWNHTTPGSSRSNERLQARRALSKFAGTKLGAAGGGALHDVGEADPVALDEHGDGVRPGLQRRVDQPRRIEGGPEPVARIGEVESCPDRRQGRIDADRDRAKPLPERIGKRVHGRARSALVHRAAHVLRFGAWRCRAPGTFHATVEPNPLKHRTSRTWHDTCSVKPATILWRGVHASHHRNHQTVQAR